MTLFHRSIALRSLACAVAVTLAAAPSRAQCSLTADVNTISLSSGQIQRLQINGPYPLTAVRVLGSFAGVSPGVVDGIGLDYDRYLAMTVMGRSPLLQSDSFVTGGLVQLDVNGLATVRVVAPPAMHSYLIGRTVYHVTHHLEPINWLQCVSQPVALTFAP